MIDILNQLNYIVDSLGEHGQEYFGLMKLWFRLVISLDELQKETRKYLTNELTPSHHNLIRNILMYCALDTDKTAYCGNQLTEPFIHPFFHEPYEPLSPLQYDVGEREEVSEDRRYFLMHERVLPDRDFIMRRMYHNALENGLKGSTIDSADILVIATQHFIKNLLTAVISRRKGYKVNHNKFIHSITEPIPNPWLINVSKHNPDIPESSKCKVVNGDIVLMAEERFSKERLEHEAIFKLSASQSESCLAPISLIDLFVTLTIYPGIIASDFLYTVTRERIMAKIDHPTYDV